MHDINDLTPLTCEEIEAALDAGELYVYMGTGPNGPKWWCARRNGKTITWVHDPKRWEIPIKVGLRATGRIAPHWREGIDFKVVRR